MKSIKASAYHKTHLQTLSQSNNNNQHFRSNYPFNTGTNHRKIRQYHKDKQKSQFYLSDVKIDKTWNSLIRSKTSRHKLYLIQQQAGVAESERFQNDSSETVS